MVNVETIVYHVVLPLVVHILEVFFFESVTTYCSIGKYVLSEKRCSDPFASKTCACLFFKRSSFDDKYAFGRKCF